jgi:FkbM family methyltransferase
MSSPELGARTSPVEWLREGGRRLTRALPPSRRVKGLGNPKGRRLLQLRKLIAPVLQRPIVLTTSSGLRLRITGDPVDEQIAQQVLGPHRGDYFPEWPNGAPAGACILDVGGHHGLYAAAALHEFAGSRIICLEPSADASACLAANLELNHFTNRARIVTAALAPESGEGVLVHTDDGSWGFSLYEDASSAASSERVALITLTDVLQRDRPDIVKCNAEGAEFALVEQLAATDIRPELMIIMVHPQFGDLDQLLERCGEMGYRVVRVGTSERPAFQLWRDAGASR